ncbi:uncharacterized protein A1O5_04051 [Cladophialophora psammophila CBS 110553]|uniref:Methyltransferase domain-containing protein n=1 Tax=Cladophialophora psammophila CBS 110553 TaxID=1182543 RepID=W9WY98_9EURO|nr:uncharacterized protein A1O5_04051 [Cladophialophora psammophila CBS 110553]EXJ72903.1 hypothetical protein A1O5_04051 [Cladophialophora psammophila CBS 110553]
MSSIRPFPKIDHFESLIWAAAMGNCFYQQSFQISRCSNFSVKSAWIIEASHELASSAELTGFDIAAHNFPAPEFLPANVKFSVLDVMTGECPSDLMGTFDVVHIRFFNGIVLNNEAQPLITTVTKLLKPGGWLQWEEMDPSTLATITPRPNIDTTYCQKLMGLILSIGTMVGTKFDWLKNFENELKTFNDVQVKHVPLPPAYHKAWTENYLILCEEIAERMPPAEKAAPNVPITREGYLDMFEKVLEEVKNGAALNSKDLIAVLARY